MAKKKQSPNFRPFSWLKGIYLSPETKHSIGVIFILLLGALMLLGLFDLAGVVGVYLVKSLKYLFGRGYFLFPFLFFIISLLSIDSERFGIKKNHYFGFGLLLMSLLGLLHLRQDYTEMSLSR